MCAERQSKVPGSITYIITRNNHLYILKKKHQNTYIILIINIEKGLDNVTFSPEVIELMIDHSNQHS